MLDEESDDELRELAKEDCPVTIKLTDFMPPMPISSISSVSIFQRQLSAYSLMKEQSSLAPIVETYGEYKKAKQSIEDSLVRGKSPARLPRRPGRLPVQSPALPASGLTYPPVRYKADLIQSGHNGR